MTRLLGALVGLITVVLCWLAFPSSAGALVPAHPHATYTYDAPVYDAPGNDSVQERGPPGVAVANTTYNAVDVWSRGPSARLGGRAAQPTITYDLPALPVQSAAVGTTTLEATPDSSGLLSSFQRSSVAANTGRTAARACSFAGATTVLMADGSRKAIEDVKVGDKVIATDPETGEQVAKRVEHVFVHEDTVIDLVVDGEVITTTEDHPFWSVTDQRFERADELSPGEEVLGADGRVSTVSGLHLDTARDAMAYNLSVRGIHTYHVGESDILVHNTCPITGLNNGDHLPTGQALDKAEQFLGGGYTQAGPGRYLSQDGLRQVRMTDADIAPRGGQLPHLNFETWASPVSSGGRNKLLDNLHIYLPEEFP